MCYNEIWLSVENIILDAIHELYVVIKYNVNLYLDLITFCISKYSNPTIRVDNLHDPQLHFL